MVVFNLGREKVQRGPCACLRRAPRADAAQALAREVPGIELRGGQGGQVGDGGRA